MTRRAAKVTQADVARVLRAWVQTGKHGCVVVQLDGSITIGNAPSEPEKAPWENKPVEKKIEFTL